MDKRILSALLLAAGAGLAAWGLSLEGKEGGPLPAGEAPPFAGRPAGGSRPLPRPAQGKPAPSRRPGGARKKEERSLRIQVCAKEDGRPLPGILVRILGPIPGGLREGKAPLLAEGRTGEEGGVTFSHLPRPPWTVAASGRAWALAQRSLAAMPDEGNPLVMGLSPGGSLEGRVRDKETGVPVAGAVVKALPAGRAGPILEARSRRDGSFFLEGLGRGRPYRLILSARGFEVLSPKETFEAGAPFLDLLLLSLSRIRIVLLPPGGGSLPGRVELLLLGGPEEGEGPFLPLGSSLVRDWPRGGNLTLSCPGPGVYKVRAASPHGQENLLFGLSRAFRVTGKEAAPPVVTLPLAAGALLEGRVLDGPGGTPLPGVLAWVRGEWEKASTGRDGRFRLSCRAGMEGSLVLRIPGKSGVFLPFRLPPGGGKAFLGDLVLPRISGRIQGALRDRRGKPLEGKRLHLAGPGLHPWNWPLETGPGGRFSQGGIPFGDWEIRLDGNILERFRLTPAVPLVTLELTSGGETQ